MKALKLGLFAFGMLAIMNVQAQERPANKPNQKKHKAHKHFKKMDANSDGKVTKEEIAKIHVERSEKRANRPTPDERFAKKDKNKDGAITKDEMKVKDGDVATRDARFKKMDTNADGRITQEELAAKKAKAKKRKGKKCDDTKCHKPAQNK